MKRHLKNRSTGQPTIHKKSDGFTLIEILVTLIVLSIGLLGLASLQANGLRSNHSSYLRSQATIFAYEMADRLRANRATAQTGSYNIALTDSAPTSNSPIENFDLHEWFAALQTTLPSGDGSINCTNTGICTIIVQWDDTRGTGTPQQFSMTTQL